MSSPLINSEIAEFVRRVQADWTSHPPFATLPISQARAIAEQVREPWRQGGPVMASTVDLSVPVEGGTMRVRRLDPGVAAPAPALIYLHGGGFMLFSIDTHDRLMREYAAAAGVVVLAVDYPLSPEARYPMALCAVVALVDWLRSGSQHADIDAGRLAIGGDSAGANLALAAALNLRDRGDEQALRALLLNYGAFGENCSDAAEAANGGPQAVLNRNEVRFYFDNYVRSADDFADPLACPARARFEGLPPAFLVVPERDVLAEQSIAMHETMAAAGVAVTSKLYPGATHSFLEAMSISGLAREAIADGAAFLRAQLGTTAN